MASLSFTGGLTSLVAAMTLVICLFTNVATSTTIKSGADPTVMKVNDTYYSAESASGGIFVRTAASIDGLGAADVKITKVYSDTNSGGIWAPELTTDGGKAYIHFSAGGTSNHRMFAISADQPDVPYSAATKIALPDDQWAIDGTLFTFNGTRWLVWSGWASTNPGKDQSLYIVQMDSPAKATGNRHVISQPREVWELRQGAVNEAPEAIVDPDGQLHIVYSANGSWGSNYCLADLRLRKGGDPTYVWDWYKSNGCLFGSHQENMMKGWDATKHIDGPGHHTFALADGDIKQSPDGTDKYPFVFHGVPKGTPYNWANRKWFSGSFTWWDNTTYTRGNNKDIGYSIKFFE